MLLLTFLAGLFQWLLGALRFGALANFVSQSVVIGFTGGAALVIALGQIPNLLGLPSLEGRATALQGALELARHVREVHGPSVLVAMATLVVTLLLRRFAPRLPALLLGLVAGSLLVLALPGSMAGVPLVPPFEGRLPPFTALRFDLDDILRLLPSAVACGLLGLVMSLSSPGPWPPSRSRCWTPTGKPVARACPTWSGPGSQATSPAAPSPARR